MNEFWKAFRSIHFPKSLANTRFVYKMDFLEFSREPFSYPSYNRQILETFYKHIYGCMAVDVLVFVCNVKVCYIFHLWVKIYEPNNSTMTSKENERLVGNNLSEKPVQIGREKEKDSQRAYPWNWGKESGMAKWKRKERKAK